MKKPIVVMTTCDSNQQARAVSQQLLAQRLAACIQSLPVQSSYLWQNKVCNSDELLLIIKTTSNCFDAVKETITALHSYEIPEIICLHIDGGLSTYIDWISASTRDE